MLQIDFGYPKADASLNTWNICSAQRKKIQYLGRYIYILLAKRRDIKSGVGLKNFLTFLYTTIYLVVGTYVHPLESWIFF